jgi:hypothetical protein
MGSRDGDTVRPVVGVVIRNFSWKPPPITNQLVDISFELSITRSS